MPKGLFHQVIHAVDEKGKQRVEVVPLSPEEEKAERARWASESRPTKAEVNVERDRRHALPVIVNVDGHQPFPVDVDGNGFANIERIALALSAGLRGDDGIEFKCGDNVLRTFAPGQFRSIYVQCVERWQAIAKASWTLKKSIPHDYADNKHWP